MALVQSFNFLVSITTCVDMFAETIMMGPASLEKVYSEKLFIRNYINDSYMAYVARYDDEN